MRKWVTIVKGTVFILAAVFSFLLNLNMFIGLSVIVFWDKFILGAISFIFEGGKIFNLVQAGEFWDKSKDQHYRKKQRIYFKTKSIRKFIIYAGLALLAIIASLGFTLVTTNYRELILNTTTNSEKIIQLGNDITDNKNKITQLNNQSLILSTQLGQLQPTYIESSSDSNVKDENNNINKSLFKSKKLDPAYVQMQQNITNQQKDIEKSIKEYQNDNTLKQAQIETLKIEESKKDKNVEAQDMFSLIGSTFHIDKKIIVFYILLFISMMLEVLLFTLSFDNDMLHKKDKEDNKLLKKINKKGMKEKETTIEDIPVEEILPVKEEAIPLPIIDLTFIKNETDQFKIEDKLLKFIYDKIFYYIKDQLRLSNIVESEYMEISFCVNDIAFNVNEDILGRYIDYLSYQGIIIRAIDNSNYPNRVYYKLKVFKAYDELLKKRIR